MKVFDNNQNGSIREAIRLGFIMLNSEDVIFVNPSMKLHPFKSFRLEEFNIADHQAHTTHDHRQ